jgi:Mg-chelatase subunit ChlD
MNLRILAIVALFAASALAVIAWPTLRTHAMSGQAIPPAGPQGYAAVEAVFVLDTTGSMGGMIETAKEKIWSIASTLAQGDPAPEISIGLVAFRDRGDQYVTRVIDLTRDLDAMYVELMKLEAAGGGDVPEAGNEALYDAIHKISWSQNPDSYKVVFLVGDAPPQMNYPDDVKYPETLAIAASKGIIVNTIQCGDMQATTHHWQRIAALGQGRYFRVEQAGGGIAINTPFDAEIARLSAEIDGTRIYYGSDEERAAMEARMVTAHRLHAEASTTARARRAGFMVLAPGFAGTADAPELIDDVASGRVDAAEVATDALPPELRELSAEQRQTLIVSTAGRRAELDGQIRELTRQRSEFIAAALEARGGATDSLDAQLFEAVREQAANVGIAYELGPVY